MVRVRERPGAWNAVARWACGLASCAVLVSASCEPGPARTGARFFDAIEACDLDGVMAILASDFRLVDGSGTAIASRAEMPTLLGWDCAADPELELGQMRVRGETVRVQVVEQNEFTRLLGLEPWTSEVRLVVRRGRIIEEELTEPAGVERSFSAIFEEAIRPVLRWAEEHAPERHSRVVGADGMRFDAPTARALLALIREHQSEAGPRSSR